MFNLCIKQWFNKFWKQNYYLRYLVIIILNVLNIYIFDKSLFASIKKMKLT